jgi:hypothetical protein
MTNTAIIFFSSCTQTAAVFINLKLFTNDAMFAPLWFILLASIVSSAQAYCDDGMYASTYSSYSQSCRYNRIQLGELLNFKLRKCSAGIAQTSLPTHTTTDHPMMEMIVLGPAMLDISPAATAANVSKARIMGQITTAATLAAHRTKILTVLLQATLCGQGQELKFFVYFHSFR